MCIPAPAITCVRTHHAQYQKKTNESFWYCAWCLRTHVIAGAGRHFPVLLPPSTLHTRQKVLKTEQIWTSIRGWTKSKILVRKTTRWAVISNGFLDKGPVSCCTGAGYASVAVCRLFFPPLESAFKKRSIKRNIGDGRLSPLRG